MRNQFRSFYTPNQQEFTELWDECIFVFDTSVLLELYSFVPSTTNRIFTLLDGIKDRVWLPYHVALEFHLNRAVIIDKANRTDKQVYNEIKDKFNGLLEIDSAIPMLGDSVSTQKQRINDLIQQLLRELEKYQYERKFDPDSDKVLDQLSHLFSDHIGAKPSHDDLHAWESEAETRFSNKVPPGYEDAAAKKEECFIHEGRKYLSKYGDLIIWRQILAEVSKVSKEIVFVTNDDKEDWWEYVKPKDKYLKRGPRRELIEEFIQAGGTSFWMYSLPSFLEQLSKYTGVNIERTVIDEVREVSGRRTTQNTATSLEAAVTRWIGETYPSYSYIETERADFGWNISAINENGDLLVCEVAHTSNVTLADFQLKAFMARAIHANAKIVLFVLVADSLIKARRVVSRIQQTKSISNEKSLEVFIGVIQIDAGGDTQFIPVWNNGT